MIKNLSIPEIFENVEAYSGKDTVYITDANIYNHYKQYFDGKKYIIIYPGETTKNFDTIRYIVDQLLIVHHASRKTFLVGVGGGVVTDITGLVASLYMRGLDFGFVSTSLLGMVDASIGGKNGVDYCGYKNIIGTFNQPEYIYWSVDFLDTLPEEEIHNGFGEILKYAIGFDKMLFMNLNNWTYDQLKNDKNGMESIIRNCQFIKKQIVISDERESGIRKTLNLGHTVAHAIEKKSSNKIPHGQAVGKGIHVMTKYSYDNKYIDIDDYERILELLDKYKFFDTDDIKLANKSKEFIGYDKKGDKDCIDLIVIDRIGSCKIVKTELEELKF